MNSKSLATLLKLVFPITFNVIFLLILIFTSVHAAAWWSWFFVNLSYAAMILLPYLKPKENGSHWGCEELTLTSATGAKLHVFGDDFSFNASHYTEEELTLKKHNFELTECGHTVLCLDGEMAGIGTNSCGPKLQKKYQTTDAPRLTAVLAFE